MTNTLDDAARSAQHAAYQPVSRGQLLRENVGRDDITVTVHEGAHDCTGSTCDDLLCVLERTVAAQKQWEREEQKEWDVFKRGQRDEEAS